MSREPFAFVETISHVAIEVQDLDASIAFYKRVFGLRLAETLRDATPSHVKGFVGDFLLEIVAVPPGVNGRALADVRRASPAMWLSLAVRDVHAAFARIRKDGLTTADAPQEKNGALFFELRDPDGYQIQLIELPDTRTLGARVASRTSLAARGERP